MIQTTYFSVPRARNTPQSVLQICMSIACANTSDAITKSYNRTKDLFTLRWRVVAMVLEYDDTIQVLSFLIKSQRGIDGLGVCSFCVCGCVCSGVSLYESQTCTDLTYFV